MKLQLKLYIKLQRSGATGNGVMGAQARVDIQHGRKARWVLGPGRGQVSVAQASFHHY